MDTDAFVDHFGRQIAEWFELPEPEGLRAPQADRARKLRGTVVDCQCEIQCGQLRGQAIDDSPQVVRVRVGSGGWNTANLVGSDWSLDFPFGYEPDGETFTVTARLTDTLGATAAVSGSSKLSWAMT